MKPFPNFAAGISAELAGELLHSEYDWTLADVLEWLAGKLCSEEIHAFSGQARSLTFCQQCYADPPVEYARDVLVAFIGATANAHPRWVDWSEEIKGLRWHESGWTTEAAAKLAMKRRILQLFSGPVEDEKCKVCDGLCGVGVERIYAGHNDYEEVDIDCGAVTGSGVIPGGGVRIVRDVSCPVCLGAKTKGPYQAVPYSGFCDACGGAGLVTEEIAPEQLLPPTAGAEYTLRPTAARV